MKRLLVLAFLLNGCAVAPQPHVPSSSSVNVTGVVQKLCLECSEALLVSGGGLLWDVLTVRVSSPDAYSGSIVSVEVLLEGIEQRAKYHDGSAIVFPAAETSIQQHRVMLHASDIGGG